MTKENSLFLIIGVLLGFIVGFMFVNSVNQRAAARLPAGGASLGAQSSDASLPAGGAQTSSIAVADPQAAQGMQAAVQAQIQQAREEPNNFDVQSKAGDLFYQIQRYDDAIKFWQQANKLRPDSYETIVKLGNANYDAERFSEAERWYTTALQKKPDDVNVRTDLGLSFFLRTPPDTERAITEFRRSLGYNPRHEQTLQNLAIALTRKGDAREAHAMLSKLEEVNPSNPALGQIRSELQKLDAGSGGKS
ncbi:MAG: tetratricopeptide repeat protein [Pyrinomonadaceae bacterium]